jgi:hypothetical protein
MLAANVGIGILVLMGADIFAAEDQKSIKMQESDYHLMFLTFVILFIFISLFDCNLMMIPTISFLSCIIHQEFCENRGHYHFK